MFSGGDIKTDPYTFTNGTVADATEVNARFDELYTLQNGNVDADNMDLTDDYAWTGAHTFSSIDFVQSLVTQPAGTTVDMGCTLAANVFTITRAAGGALSASNPAWIVCPSTTAGQNVALKIVAAKTVEDDGHGTTTLNAGLMGTTASIAWGSAMPWFVYVYEDPDSAGAGLVFFSRSPSLETTPASADNIGMKGDDPDAAPNTQNDIFVLESGLTKADHISLPCVLVGALRVTRGTDADDDWTFTALGNNDGIGLDRLLKTFKTVWTFPVNQNGAEAGKHYTTTDGATALAFTGTNSCFYMIHSDGTVTTTHVHETQSTNGADGTAVRWMLPCAVNATMRTYGAGEGKIADTFSAYIPKAEVSLAYVTIAGINQGYNSGAMSDNQFSNTNDYVNFTITFKAFG